MPQEAFVIYDDDCGFCRWSLAVLLSVDRSRGERGALRPLPLGTAEADYLLHDLTVEERNASWHLVIDPPGEPGAEQLSFDTAPTRFSAGAAFVPALRLLPRGRRLAFLVARVPGPTERGYRWVADHRGLLGRFVSGRARDWADQVIAAHGGPAPP
ncbi:MAG TPA: DCC1-like thiol-disulfide oxidoreductase family protein [Solirubrobacterales bacterium]|jgi:predicted DCC family thiol-disulfide oxidoreductase YuxK